MKYTIHSYIGRCLDCSGFRTREFRSKTEALAWMLAHYLRYPSHIGSASIGQQWEEIELADTNSAPDDLDGGDA